MLARVISRRLLCLAATVATIFIAALPGRARADNRSVGGSDPLWNLDRIDQRTTSPNDTYQFCGRGTGTVIYVVDNGVDSRLTQLSGRLTGSPDFAPDENNSNLPDSASFTSLNPCGNRNWVGGGHGTAVATIAAGTDLGIAPGASVVAVRTNNCTGYPSFRQDLVNGLQWIRSSANPNFDFGAQRPVQPSVINLSQAWPLAQGTDIIADEIKQLIQRGFVVVVSANNQNAVDQAVTQTPTLMSYSNDQYTGAERVISAGGTMLIGTQDKRWVCVDSPHTGQCNSGNPEGSNYGRGVDIWAPAYDIQSGHIFSLTGNPVDNNPWSGSQMRRPFLNDTAERLQQTYSRSGTSFAAPMVAGAIARLMSEDSSIFNISDKSHNADRAWARLRDSATILDRTAANLGATSTNRFLYLGGLAMLSQPQSMTIADGDAAPLSAPVGSSSATYTLYSGVTGNTLTVVQTSTTGSFSVIPSANTTYWIRAVATCSVDSSTVSTDSANATVTILPKPVLTATASSTTTVNLTWTTSTGALSYDVFRRNGAGAFQQIHSMPNGTSYSDTGLTPNTTYVYKVIARGPSPGGAESKPDVATTVAFTDPTLTRHGTPMRVEHITELRVAVNAVRVAAGLAETSFGPAPVRDMTEFSLTFVAALRQALDPARQALGLAPIVYTDSPLVPDATLLRIEHIQELRGGVQ